MIEDKKLAAAIAAADEGALTALANKGLYKRAVKDAGAAALDYTEMNGTALVLVGGEKCVVTAPLSESKCSCPSRTVCRHILTAILLLKTQVPEAAEQTEPEAPPASEEKPAPVPEAKAAETPKPKGLSSAELSEVHECVEMCFGLICGVLSHGLVRVSDMAHEDFELAAVRCHAAKMAECERLMRGLGGRLADCTARRASFDSRLFAQKLTEAADCLDRLSGDDITPDTLGSFRGSYEDYEGRLDIIPVGQRSVSGGEHEGEIFYFVNADESAPQRFLTFSDLRPTYYEQGRRRPPAASPWGLGAPLRSMMKQRMTLVGAKISGGRLSSSKETVVTSQSAAVLDSSTIHRMMCTDFREIAVALADRDPGREADRLFFVYPKALTEYGFDSREQQLFMTLEDDTGCTAECIVKYRAETKSFIELLERICANMKKSPLRVYSLLVSAYIADGRLRFFPIEIYDFITPVELHTFTMPGGYALAAENGGCAEEIQRLLSDVREFMTSLVQTGLQSSRKYDIITESCRVCGMEGLAGFVEEAAAAAERSRHSTEDNSREVLRALQRLETYLNAAEKRVGVLSALYNLSAT